MNVLFFGIFMVFVIVMLVLDLFVFHKKDKVVGVKEAAAWTGVWVGLAMAFSVLVYFFGDWMMPPDAEMLAAEFGDVQGYRSEMTQEFLAGYFLEESLSIDNIFVMIMIFVSFGIKKEYYHRVLFWGIFGAIVLRFIFIFALGALVTKFSWVLAVFGAVLIYSGVKMFRDKGNEEVDTANHPVVKFASKYFPVTNESHGHDFFHAGKMTPLFLVLLVIEFSDIVFAVDSIPAVFSVSRDPFIVLTSNIFAILGLRALYFALAAVAKYFTYLKYGLGIILCFVGVKMLLAMNEYVNDFARLAGFDLNMPHIEIPTPISLAIIFGVLVLSMLLSVVISKRAQ